jgi:hypothetical protein
MNQQPEEIKTAVPGIWAQLPAQQRQQLAKLIASMIRRLRQPDVKKDEVRNE